MMACGGLAGTAAAARSQHRTEMNTRDIYGGAALIGFAGAYALAASGLSMTSSLGIGSGLFPMVLAVILALIGCVVLVQGILASNWTSRSERGAGISVGRARGRPSLHDAAPTAPLPWRAIILIAAAPILFGFTIEPLGLVPSLFAATFLAALANRGTTLLGAAALAACLVVFSIALFVWGLGLPLALFGSWLPFGG
jgi:hypothetical protein